MYSNKWSRSEAQFVGLDGGTSAVGGACFGRKALGSEHALDDEIREAAAHLRQLIFNRKDGHRLARYRCRIQPAEHL